MFEPHAFCHQFSTIVSGFIVRYTGADDTPNFNIVYIVTVTVTNKAVSKILKKKFVIHFLDKIYGQYFVVICTL